MVQDCLSDRHSLFKPQYNCDVYMYLRSVNGQVQSGQ